MMRCTSRRQVAPYLRALAGGLETGVLRLRSGEREVELHPVPQPARIAHFSAPVVVRQELTAHAAVFLNCRPPLSLVPCAK
jgi:hypothetical protein